MSYGSFTMPKRKESEPLVKVTLNLYARDWTELQRLHPVIGASKALRTILRNYISSVEAKVARATEPTLASEIDVDLPEEKLANV